MRVVSLNQEIDVWVFGRTRARLRVGESSTSHYMVEILLFPPIVSFEPKPAKNDAVLLSTDTEVSIAPKKRQSKSRGPKVIKDLEETKKEHEPRPLNRKKLRVMPHSFFHLHAIPKSAGPLALVSIDTYIALSHAQLPLEVTDGFGPVTVLRYRRPVNPLSPDSEVATRNSDEEPASKVIHSANKATEGDEASRKDHGKSDVETVTIRWARALSNSQVLFFNFDLVKDWEPW